MGLRGPAPKSAKLKLLRGNAGHRRADPGADLVPAVGAERPEWLPRPAAAAWDELAPMLTRLRILTELDGPALAIYCVLIARFREQARKGEISVRLAGELRGFAARFGMTPGDRSRVKPVDARPKTKLERFLG